MSRKGKNGGSHSQETAELAFTQVAPTAAPAVATASPIMTSPVAAQMAAATAALPGNAPSPLAHEAPLAGATEAGTAVMSMPMSGVDSIINDPFFNQMEHMGQELLRAEELVISEAEAQKQATNERLNFIHQRMARLGVQGKYMAAGTPAVAPARRGPKPGFKRGPNKPKAAAQMQAVAKGGKPGRKMNKTAAVLRLLVEQCRTPQFRRQGMTADQVTGFTSQIGLSRTETQTGLQALTRARPPKATYTPGPGAKGRGGHYKATPDGVAAYDAGMLSG